MISTHTYAAQIVGGAGLSMKSGRVILDSGRWPHVTGQVTVAVSDPALYAALDPRQNVRVKVTATATFPTFSQSRVFDLGVRRASPNRVGGDVVLQLASDEALLQDYAPTAEDRTPWQYQTSVRALTNYVLSKIGATLQPGPEDADVTPYWAVTNLIPNPSVRNVVGNWIAGGVNGSLARMTGLVGGPVPGVTTYTRTTWTGNSGLGAGGAYGQTGTVAPTVTARPFQKYRLAVWVRANVAKSVRLSVQIFAQDGSVLSGGTDLTTVNLTANTWTLLEGTFTTPANAAKIGVFSYPPAGQQWAAGNTYDTLGWILHEGDLPVPTFDAASSGGGYLYTASGDANVSASTRTPYPLERSPELLIWPAGKPALEFIAPILQASGLRLVCDEQRRWTLRKDDYAPAGALALRWGVNIVAAGEEVSRESDDWYDGMVVVYNWRDMFGNPQTRVDSYVLPSATKVLRLDVDAPYPGPGRAQWAVARAQGKGRTLEIDTVSDWSAVCEQFVTVTLDGTPVQAGKVESLEYDFGNDRMTTRTRTADIPAGAIDLLSGTIDALPGTIDSL